jgi:hypothetical protein
MFFPGNKASIIVLKTFFLISNKFHFCLIFESKFNEKLGTALNTS